jgi:Protein of unknown function (DUF3047)
MHGGGVDGARQRTATPMSALARSWVLVAGMLALPSLLHAQALAPLIDDRGMLSPAWQAAGMPTKKKPLTRFDVVDLEGKRVLRVEADASYGNLTHRIARDGPMRMLSWRWRVDQLIATADQRLRSGDDTAVKVCAMFDLPLSSIPFADRQLLRAARAMAGEELPGATVCYVWDNKLPQGTELPNAFTNRMRIIVLRGAGSRTGEWSSERRDVRADFLRLFGDESTDVPPLLAVVVAADADNTQGRSLAYVSDMTFE